MPRISIITATFNSEFAIANVIQCLEMQTFQDYEWIVVDGLSTDKTLELIGQFDIKSKIVISESDSGIYEALNKGLQLAKGDYVIFLHSDDFWNNKNFLENYNFQASESVDILYSNVIFINAVGDLKRKWFDPWRSQLSIINGWMPPHVSLMVRTDILKRENLFFDQNLTISSDYDWVLSLAQAVEPKDWVYLNNEFVTMRTGGASNGSMSKYFISFIEDVRVVHRYKAFFRFILQSLNVSVKYNNGKKLMLDKIIRGIKNLKRERYSSKTLLAYQFECDVI
jgi:glycosyltransferase